MWFGTQYTKESGSKKNVRSVITSNLWLEDCLNIRLSLYLSYPSPGRSTLSQSLRGASCPSMANEGVDLLLLIKRCPSSCSENDLLFFVASHTAPLTFHWDEGIARCSFCAASKPRQVRPGNSLVSAQYGQLEDRVSHMEQPIIYEYIYIYIYYKLKMTKPIDE